MKHVSHYIRDLRDREKSKRFIAYLVLSWGLFGIFLQFARSFLSDDPLRSFINNFVYFTTQSNILITIISYLYLRKKNDSILYSSLSFIALINILVTGIVFHILLTPYMSSVSFLNHVLHTINPLIYVLFYFVVVTEYPAIKKVWIVLIYPMIYMLFVYLFVEPVLGNNLDQMVDVFDSARYVYPFLDPRNYERGFLGVLIFNLGILAPVMIIFSIFLLFLKQKFEHIFQLNSNKKEVA